MRSYLDFEKPVAELEAKVEELRAVAARGGAVSIGEELTKLEAKAAKALADLYKDLTPWQKTLVARHPQRPRFLDFVKGLITEFTPLAGDRKFARGRSHRRRLGRFRGAPVCVIGQEKGTDTKTRLAHNFGMARPGGLSQGGAADGAGRPVRRAGALPRRHRRAPFPASMPRSAARPRRSPARPTPRWRSASPMSRCSRRGRLRRRGGDRQLQPGADARACDLHGRLAGGLGLDPLARFVRARRTPRPA